MKTLLMALALVTTSSAMAVERSALIKSPKHPGSQEPFSHYEQGSSENGVCRILGYEKAARGSSRSGQSKANTLRVNQAGRIIGAPKTYVMSRIICLNKVSRWTEERSYLLNSRNLRHPGSGEPFSHYDQGSNENGVCKILGYEKAAAGSSRSNNTKSNSLRVNENGTVIGAPQTYTMNRLVCINQEQGGRYNKSVLLTGSDIVHPDSDMPFSHYDQGSNEHGVCKVLGYKKAAPGSSRSGSSKSDTLRVNAAGDVIASPYTYFINRIVCLTRGRALRTPTRSGWNSGVTIVRTPQPQVQHSVIVHNVDYRDQLGFDFEDRALLIADVIFDVVTALEPYVNNADEQELDEIKAQTIKLRSRINGERSLKIVRNTLSHLGTLLANSNELMESLIESDNLDRFAEDLMTARESITTMVSFLDGDFKGTRAELY
jgi:hypothetical protein